MTAGDDGIVAGQEGGDDGMRCPVCGFVNLVGADICDNCGADIFGHDTPMQAPAFRASSSVSISTSLGRRRRSRSAPTHRSILPSRG